jgi:hypothetical protein
MEKAEGLAAFVGIDAHRSPCSLKALGRQGEDLLTVEVPSQAGALRAALRGLPRPRAVMLESSSQAALIRGWLWSAVEEVAVCETRENRLISRSEEKSDPADAARLARLRRLGEYQAVSMPARAGPERRELVRRHRPDG